MGAGLGPAPWFLRGGDGMRARTTIALGVLFFGALLGGCLPREGGDSGCPTCPGGGAVETVVPFETVDRGTQSGIRDARRLVIRD